MSTFSLPSLTLPDGSTLALSGSWTAAATLPPPPPPIRGPIPLNPAPTLASVGASSFALSGVNPSSTAFPGGRAANQLMAYQAPLTATSTNVYGAELTLSAAGVILAVNDRQTSGSAVGTAIPAGGYVLSGHGSARDWLLTLKVGSTVTLSSGTVSPLPPVITPSGKVVAVYLMMWTGHGTLSGLPSAVNEARLAFAQGSPPALVGVADDGTPAGLAADVAAYRARGGKVLVSIGGEGGQANIGDHATFLAGISSIYRELGGGLDGLDFDLEAVQMSTVDAVALAVALKAAYGQSFRITFTPNGSNVNAYLAAAVACQRANALDFYTNQLYDAPVTEGAAAGRIQEAITAGIPVSKIGPGMMEPVPGDNTANYWTLAQCTANYAQLKAQFPGLGGCVLWESSRTGAAAWATAMAALV